MIPLARISSLHDDLLWPKVAHECGLGEFRPDGTRAPAAERSRLGRTAQFGVDPEGFDPVALSRRGEGYESYGQRVGAGIATRYETVVAAIFDRYLVTETHGPNGPPSTAEMQRSVGEAVDGHAHFGIPLVRGGDGIVSGRVNLILGIEGMDFVHSLAPVDDLLARGVRVFGLQYDRSNRLADVRRGLTELGRATVARIFAFPAIVDIAHASPATRRQVMDIAEGTGHGARVAYSHGSTRADAVRESAWRSPNRYLAEKEVRRLAAMGGIVGLTPTRLFFTSLVRVAERIDAICQRAGGSHSVALGTDFGGVCSGMLFSEIQSVSDLWRIGEVLADRHGFTDAQIEHVLCTNATRWVRHALG